MVELLKVIKFEGGDDTLVYKFPAEDFNTHSQLIVHQSQEAIFFKDGKALDLFGPGKYTLYSENIPLLRGIINIPTEGVSPFHCEVFFINKANSLNMEWGTSSRFQIIDPQFGIMLSIGASGALEFKINDSRKFLIKVVGTQNIVTNDQLMKYFKQKIVSRTKDSLATLLSEVSYFNATTHLDEISEAIHKKLNEEFQDYGIELIDFYVSTLFAPDKDTDKLKDVLNKQMEYGTLNFNWADEQMADIAKKYAENPGQQDSVGGVVTQIPIAMAFGEMLKEGVVDGMKSPFSQQYQAFNNKNMNVENGDDVSQSDSDTSLNSNSQSDSEVSSNSKTDNVDETRVKNVNGNNTIKSRDKTSNSEGFIPVPVVSETKKPNFCTNCGAKLNPKAKFCNQCGVKIKKDLKCPKCGVEVKENFKFCENCGEPLNN